MMHLSTRTSRGLFDGCRHTLRQQLPLHPDAIPPHPFFLAHARPHEPGKRVRTTAELRFLELFGRDGVPYQEKETVVFIVFASEKTAVFQVVLDDDISDGVEDKLHILGVCGAGEVSVNLLGVLPLVQVLELTLNVGGGLLVRVGAWDKKRKSR